MNRRPRAPVEPLAIHLRESSTDDLLRAPIGFLNERSGMMILQTEYLLTLDRLAVSC